ncbi:thiamine-phosphate kinase [Bowmanella dokdonensis]|uniref:Thiamine-monophosphate kinase n=1 Tax=Bowmanella dokdonensis TaxID=751969 RepID=A0A939ISF4_9ALTE|nr:AIR synthase related protein [Bowmanella dokdonensis]MBN7827129.1 hypothetical protein [Bowmanella dokdonensis]
MTTMSEIGEKEFIKGLLPSLSVDSSFVNGFGHDASIIDVGLDQLIACKIDRAPSPVSLKHGIGDAKTWGRLAVVANVSDLLSVGAVPKALMLSLVLPDDFDVISAREIVMGCEEACRSHGIAFVGGDTKEGDAAQVIGAAWGTLLRGTQFGRGSAMPGDYLFIAGRLGAFSGSMALMNKRIFDKKIPNYYTNVLTHPMARVIEGRYMRESRKVAFACDLSDGLSEAIRIFCKEGVGITLHEKCLPMHTIAEEASFRTEVPLWQFALGVGDWAIACVVRQEEAASFKALMPNGLEIFQVGRFDETGLIQIQDKKGIKRELPPLINEHFRQRAEDDTGYLHELLRSQSE